MAASVAHSMATSTSLSSVESTRPSTDSGPMKLKKNFQIYAKIMGSGTLSVVILIFAVLSIYWGSLDKIPKRNLHGWVIDFDGGLIGQQVVQVLTSPSTPSKVIWNVVSASHFSSLEQVSNEVFEEKTWVALAINQGASIRLQASLASPNATYNGADAISVFASEARNENAFRSLIRPTVQSILDTVAKNTALGVAKQIAISPNVANILSTSPQTITQPVHYRLINITPFDQSLAVAVIFVGLIYQIILTFFVVMIGLNARQISQLERLLPMRKLIMVRMGSSFIAYFFLSLFYSLLSLAFQLDLTKKFGHGGFVIFWMLNFVGMLALGLALEAMITLLTERFVPFFMLTWIITNVSVSAFPIEILPTVYRYGYAAPFYNISKAMRTILFGTKNTVRERFGILLIWLAISCITLPVFMILTNKRRGGEPEVQLQEVTWEHENKRDRSNEA